MNRAKQHIVLTVNPDAEDSWDRLSIRDSITFETPDLRKILGQLHQQPGSYLLKVTIESEIVEKIELKPE
jgi:hypothetical protein